MQLGSERTAVVIEDDADVRNLISAILHEAGFACVPTSNGIDGINAVRQHQPILTTLDVSLPGIDGFEVARRIRAFSQTYIFMLSARDEEIDTLMGLDAGADDYLTKPFRPRELRARIEAMLRRYNHTQPSTLVQHDGGTPVDPSWATVTVASTDTLAETSQGWLSHNGLRMHPEAWLCELDGKGIDLTRSEFDLLLALLEGNRKVLSKDSLALHLRGGHPGEYVSDSDRRTVEVHMANLRRKLHDPVSAPRFVETVRGVGYRLTEPRPE